MIKIFEKITYLILLSMPVTMNYISKADDPVRVGVIGLTHTHVHWILGRPDKGDIQIVGIVESDRDLADRYSRRHGFSMDLVFRTMEALIEAVELDAATAFGTTGESDQKKAEQLVPARLKPPHDDPFSRLAAVVKGSIKPAPHDFSSLENNLLVVEILDAAYQSGKEQRTVRLDKKSR